MSIAKRFLVKIIVDFVEILKSEKMRIGVYFHVKELDRLPDYWLLY